MNTRRQAKRDDTAWGAGGQASTAARRGFENCAKTPRSSSGAARVGSATGWVVSNHARRVFVSGCWLFDSAHCHGWPVFLHCLMPYLLLFAAGVTLAQCCFAPPSWMAALACAVLLGCGPWRRHGVGCWR